MTTRLLADENVPKSVVAMLRNANFNVQWIPETALRSIGNSELVERAVSTEAVVLTCDSDFIEIASNRVMLVYLEQTGNPQEMTDMAAEHIAKLRNLLRRGKGAILITKGGLEVG